MLKELIKNITPVHLLGYLAAILLGIILCKLTVKKHEGFYSDPVINPQYTAAWGQDIFKSEDEYDKGSLLVSLKNPGKIMADTLMGQQNIRQFFHATYDEKFNIATINMAVATADLDKASVRLDMAKEKVSNARMALDLAAATLAFTIAQQAYAASNLATVDPSVAIRAGAAAGTIAVKLAQASQDVATAELRVKKMQNEQAIIEVELGEFKARFDMAMVALAKSKKELNEVMNFLEMSRESEYLKKRFYPFATQPSAQAKKECDALEPMRA